MLEPLVKKITLEIENIDKLFSDSKPLFDLCKLQLPDFIEAAASALTLHSFYNGVENILSLIEKECGAMPSGTNWHTQLFEKAFQTTEKRVKIFSDELKPSLKEYLTFRHFIRHAYAYSIDAERISPLINTAESTWVSARSDIKTFIENN